MNSQTYFTQEQRTYTFQGDDTVSAAMLLMGKLPNGWKLCSLEHKDGWWVAIVQERREQHNLCG